MGICDGDLLAAHSATLGARSAMPVLPWMQGWPFGVPIGHVLLLDAYCGPHPWRPVRTSSSYQAHRFRCPQKWQCGHAR